jgi:hypothetical protein
VAYKYGLFHHPVNPSLPLLIFAAALSSSPNWLGFLRVCWAIHRKISMADTRVVDLDAGVGVEKCGRGRPRGSKNKPKVIFMAVSSSASAKRCPGRPLGSKNKPKSSTSQINEPLDVSVMTHKYRGSQQSSREVKPKFIDSTQGEPKNIYKP